ncbi:uncharacterized protein LOC143562020 [Bidens hawaiensis]|uniref:uncharacterized protein LOC143562020 n=1 Tax=Bidens hawaiensis TaxID=980011 RepID=UPI00404B3B95
MAPNIINIIIIIIITLFLSILITPTNSQPSLNSVEQESLYRVLESLNSDIPWRTLFPDDLCSSAPHGVVCGYTTLPTESDPGQVNIQELNFGYVSDHNPNPPCNPNTTTFDPNLFSSFPYLRKLFFYKCFTTRPVFVQSFIRVGSGQPDPGIEEMLFIENPGLFGSLGGSIGGMTGLRRLVITGSNVSGEIPSGFGLLKNLEEVKLSGNNLAGVLPENISNLKNLKVFDLSGNGFEGNIPAGIGELKNLIKLDFSRNMFEGNIPASFKGLKSLEFLDMSYNKFKNCGVPLVFGEMSNLKGLFMSGNELGGVIPDIWGKLRGVNAIGLSNVGVFGDIPSSIGLFLSNLSYLALDNNKLSGSVPMEFERLEMLSELNLKNNNLSGGLPFSSEFVSRIGRKLVVQGNTELCLDGRVFRSFVKVNGNLGCLKVCKMVENPKSAFPYDVSSSSLVGYQVVSLLLVMFVWLATL